MLNKLKIFFKEDDGATMIEYALMLGLIAVVCVAAVRIIGTVTNNSFQSAADQFSGS